MPGKGLPQDKPECLGYREDAGHKWPFTGCCEHWGGGSMCTQGYFCKWRAWWFPAWTPAVNEQEREILRRLGTVRG